jgi:hypothetical protein
MELVNWELSQKTLDFIFIKDSNLIAHYLLRN